MESRMRGDMQVRFGGRYEETYCRKAARRLVPSLRIAFSAIGDKIAGLYVYVVAKVKMIMFNIIEFIIFVFSKGNKCHSAP